MLNAFELMKAMIEAGAAGVHFEDQLASVKKCGHMGGKVLVPTQEAIQKLIAARLAADVMGVPTIVLARTDAEAADLLTSDVDENDKPFMHGRAHAGGLLSRRSRASSSRSRAASPTRRTPTWSGARPASRTSTHAKTFAEAIHKKFPGKLLAYNCSPSFNWKKNLDDATIAKFQRELGAMGYKFQFITLAGFHNMWFNMFDLAQEYVKTRHDGLRREGAGAGVRGARPRLHRSRRTSGKSAPATSTTSPRSIQGGHSSTTAMHGSTEEEQFAAGGHH